MKKNKERTILFILSMFLFPFLLAFEPELHIIVNNEFNFGIFLKTLFLINLGAVLIATCFGEKKTSK